MRYRRFGPFVVLLVLAGIVTLGVQSSGAQDGGEVAVSELGDGRPPSAAGAPPEPEYKLEGTPAQSSDMRIAEAVPTPTEHLWNAGYEAFGADFAGVSGFDGDYTVRVKRSPDRVLPETFEGYPLVISDYSYAELDEAKVRLDVGWEPLVAEYPGLVGWWANFNEDAVTVFYLPSKDASEGEVARVEEAASAAAGGVRVKVDVVDERPGTTANRWYDTPVWKGGARIKGLTYPAECTSGYGWINQYGMPMMTTAGHCYFFDNFYWTTMDPNNQYGHQIWNGLFGGPPWHNDAAAMVHYVQPYFGMIYRGGPLSQSMTSVKTWYPGAQYNVSGIRTSGSTTGEWYQGNGYVYVINTTLLMDGHYAPINGLNIADCRAEGGDSGGPVFVIGGDGKLIAAGTITGHWGNYHCAYTPTNIHLAHHGGGPMTSGY